MEFSFEQFVQNLEAGDQREFWYNGNILVFRNDWEGSTFSIESKGKIILEQKFMTLQELLYNVKIEGKGIEEIWSELILAI